MKRALLFIFLILLAGAAYIGWQVFGPTVKSPEGGFLFIHTGSTYADVKKQLKDQNIIYPGFFFDQLSKKAKYPSNIKAGRYAIKEGMSLYDLVRKLKSGQQEPVRLVINKLRTKEDLAGKIGRQFEADSTQIIALLLNNDSLQKYNLDTNTIMTSVIPNTYMFWWNSSARNIIDRLHSQHDLFWEGKRTEKAKTKGFTPEQIYTIASIVEEETNKQEDKGPIASVYINRIHKGMKLEADPTVKYALRAFGLKRILYAHLQYASPYNTYRNTGLPPGPICTPSAATIDAVLDAPDTDYIFFVAKPSFDGYSNFASNYEEHLKFAKAYQKALDSLIIAKRKQNP